MAETDALLCPGCHTPLPPEATGCQICMRPRSKQEIMRGYAKLREEKTRKRRLPFKILAFLLVIGGGGRFVMLHRDRIRTAAASAGDAIVRWSDNQRDPKNYAPSQAQPTAAQPAPAAPLAPEGAPRAKEPGYSGQGPAAAPAAATPAAPRPPARDAWRVSGTVYDLATLDPVAGAEVEFLRNERRVEVAIADENGRYEVDLAKGGGWTVRLNAPGRRPGQVLDIDPPYRVRDHDERRAAFDHLTDGDLIPAPVGWKNSVSKARLDLVAVPTNWAGAPQR